MLNKAGEINMKLRTFILLLVGIFSLVGLSPMNATSIFANEQTYDYLPSEIYFDRNTIPKGNLVVGDSGQIRPNQNSIFKDFEYAFKYKLSDFGVISIDEKGNWEAIGPGQVTLWVHGRSEYNESLEFEAELDKHGIVRVNAGIYPTVVPDYVKTHIIVTENPLSTEVYRLYNPNLKVHLYTQDSNEYNVLATRGWEQEGVAWLSHNTEGEPVFRLYHPGLKVHLYTRDVNEFAVLVSRGWNQEGIAYRSKGDKEIYRLYHEGVKKHLYTTNEVERDILSTRGWSYEGIAWYGS